MPDVEDNPFLIKPVNPPPASSGDSALELISKYESGDRNVPNYRYDRGHTAQGYYQITNTNWRNYGPRAGVDLKKHPNAMAAPREVQASVAGLMHKERGFADWAPFNPRLQAALQRGEGGEQEQNPFLVNSQSPSPPDNPFLTTDEPSAPIVSSRFGTNVRTPATMRRAGAGASYDPFSRLTAGAGPIKPPRKQKQLDYGQMRREEYPRDLSIGELRQAEDQPIGFNRRGGQPSRVTQTADELRVMKGEQPVNRQAYARQQEAQARIGQMRDLGAIETSAETASREQQDAEWRQKHEPEIQRQTEKLRQAIRSQGGDPDKWLAEFVARGGAGLTEFLAGIPLARVTGVGDRLRIASEAAQRAAIAEGADRNAVSKFAQDVSAGFVGSAPELAAMALGAPPVGTFAVGSGVRAAGSGRPIPPAMTHGALTGLAFETPGVGKGLTKALTRAGGVGAASTGVELATGADPYEALKTGATNALMVGAPEVIGGRKNAKVSPDVVANQPPAEVGRSSEVGKPSVSETVGVGESQLEQTARDQAMIREQFDRLRASTEPPPVHHSNLQPRRARNTETGTRGQFKKGKPAETQPANWLDVTPEEMAKIQAEVKAEGPPAARPLSPLLEPEVSPAVREGESILDKHPWEVTLKELEGRWTREQHRKDVEGALKQGFDVPARVLAEYPDLKPSPQVEAVEPETKGKPNVAQKALEPESQTEINVQPALEGAGQGPPARETAPAPTGVARVSVGDLSLDPERFQYKMNRDARGSTGSLADVRHWNDQFAGLIQVWRDPTDGKTYVVNGHNRFNKAVETDTERVNVQYIDAPSAKEARAAGAKSNIASGDGTALDAAQYFRDSGESPETLKSEGLPLNNDVAKHGIALSQLNDFVFNAVRKGDIPEAWGVAIGSKIKSPDLQSQSYKAITKAGERRSLSKGVVDEILDQVSAAPRETQTEQTLFGDFETEKSLFTERAQVAAAIKRQLSQDKSLFGTAARKSGRLAEGGTTVDVEQAKQLQESAAEALGVFDTLKNRTGDISEILDKGAKDVAAGKRPDQVAKEIYAQIKNAVNEAIRGRVKPLNEGGVETPEQSSGAAGPSSVAGQPEEPPLIRAARERQEARAAEKAQGIEYRRAGADPYELIDTLLIKGHELYKAGKPKFDEWVKKMREYFGREHDTHLPDIYARITSSQKVDEVLRKARSLPKTLEASGREKGTELEYDVLPNPTTIQTVADRIAKDGVEKTEAWYRKAEPSAERTEAFRQIGDQLLTQAVYEKDSAKAQDLLTHGVELANTEAVRSTTLGQTVQAYSINTKFSPSGALLEASKLSERTKKDLSKEDAEYITRKAVEHQEADTNVKALQEQAELFEGTDRQPKSIEERIKQSGADPQVIHGATRLLKDRDMGRGEFYREMKKKFGLSQDEATNVFQKAYRLLKESRKAQVEANKQAKIRKENPTASDKQRQEIYEHLANELKRRGEAKRDLAKAFSRLERTNRTYWDRLVNLQRSAMVSRFSTAIRNAQTQWARGGIVESGVDFVETALRQVLRLDNPLGYRDAWQHMAAYLHPKGQRAKAEAVLQEFPTEHELMLGRYAADVDLPNVGPLTKGAESLLGKAETGYAMLNYVNSLQEFTARSIEGNIKLNQELKRMGKPPLEEYLRRGKAEDIPVEAIRAMAKQALQTTFAERPGYDTRLGKAANALIDIGNAFPASVSPIGFPRYFYSSMKFLWEHNPTGFLTAFKAENKPRAVARALVGTTMLLTAYQVRKHDGGEKWYELRVPGTKQIIDMRPFGPFSLYLFVAEAVRRGLNHEQGFTKREIGDAIGIAAVPGGGGAIESVYDILTNQSESVQAKAWRALKREGGEGIGAFLSPLSQIKDIIAQFDRSEGVRKDVGTAPLTGPSREMIPYASRGLPAAHTATATAPIHQEQPLLKLLTGYRVETPKNFIQSELDRLNFNPSEVYKASGIPEFDNRVKELMGKRIESIAEPRSHNLGYKNATDARKRWILREDLRQIRKDVLEQVEGEMPEAARKLKVMRQSRIDRDLGIPPGEGGSVSPLGRPSALERPTRP